MERVDQEFRLAKEHYAGMTEGEIRALAAEAYKMTETGRDALEAVIAEKGFKIQLAELDLSIVCILKSEADARRAKGILDAKHIASCLGPDNVADLENFKGSFDSGIDLKVFAEDSLSASRVLDKYAPDLRQWDDEVLKDAELDYAVICPKCQSQDIILEGTTDPPPEYDRPYCADHIGSWRKASWTCATCGHQWQDDGVSHIVNNNARGHSSSSD